MSEEPNPVRIIISEMPDADDGVFKIIGASGRDITDELQVESVHIVAKAFERTRATIVVYCDAEVAIHEEVVKLHAKLCAEGMSIEVGGEDG